jgi:hypothetical protein
MTTFVEIFVTRARRLSSGIIRNKPLRFTAGRSGWQKPELRSIGGFKSAIDCGSQPQQRPESVAGERRHSRGMGTLTTLGCPAGPAGAAAGGSGARYIFCSFMFLREPTLAPSCCYMAQGLRN